MKSSCLCLLILWAMLKAHSINNFIPERSLRATEAQALEILNPRALKTVIRKNLEKKHSKKLFKNKLFRLANALKKIRKFKNKKRKSNLKRHRRRAGRKHHKRQKHSKLNQRQLKRLENRKLDGTNALVHVKNFVMDTSENLGHVVGYVPKKIGFDYSEDKDYQITGLGTIGFAYGLYSYLSRRRKFNIIMNILEDRYKTNGLHLVSTEDENSDLVFINRKLAYIKNKMVKTKKTLLQKIQYFDNPFF